MIRFGAIHAGFLQRRIPTALKCVTIGQELHGSGGPHPTEKLGSRAWHHDVDDAGRDGRSLVFGGQHHWTRPVDPRVPLMVNKSYSVYLSILSDSG